MSVPMPPPPPDALLTERRGMFSVVVGGVHGRIKYVFVPVCVF